MPGVRPLRRIQLGRETTAGTATAATALWRGTGTLKDLRDTKWVKEDVGYLGPLNRSYVPKLGASITLAETEATFEQLPYILTCAFAALTTGVADSTGSGKIYTYNLATTAQATPTTLTIEGGDDAGAERMEYGFVDNFKLSGKAGEALMMSCDFQGRQVAVNAFTSQPATPVVEQILFSKGKLYIDALSGTAGTTLVSNTLVGLELTVKTGFVPVYTADGNLYFTFIKQVDPELKLNLTFEHETTALAEKVNWRAGTGRQIQAVFAGSTLTTAGNYTVKTLKLTFAGAWDTFSTLDEQNGNDIVTGTFQPAYDPVNSKAAFQAIVVNQLTSLP
jgi:hypothetical protein